MTVGYDISLATPDDISGILVLQEPNLPDSGGSLSVRLTEDWFRRAISEKSVVVGRRDGKVVGYVSGTSLAAKAHVAIIQTMLRAFPPPPDCYLYGPVCVADTERGKGLAGAMFKTLQKHKDDRPAMTFVRADNELSLRAHDKIGMERLGTFTNDRVPYVAFRYTPRAGKQVERTKMSVLGPSYPLCPITGEPAIRHVQWVKARWLARMWKMAHGVDTPELADVKYFGLWESPTGLYFFDPMVEGSHRFYNQYYAWLLKHKL